ncbi:hypothetical protein ACU686_24780 [Yinghuangia aomiensis]
MRHPASTGPPTSANPSTETEGAPAHDEQPGNPGQRQPPPGADRLVPPGGQRRRLRLAGVPEPDRPGQDLHRRGPGRLVLAADPPDRHHDIVLLAAEFVANAAMHAGGPREIVLELSDGGLRIEVSDGSTVLPAPRSPTAPACPAATACSSSNRPRTGGVRKRTIRARRCGRRSTRSGRVRQTVVDAGYQRPPRDSAASRPDRQPSSWNPQPW